MTEECLTLARRLTGAVADDVLLEPLCRAAQGRLEARLRHGLTPMDCGGAFSYAAALLTTADWRESRMPEESGLSFRAGDVSVTARSPAEQGDALQALRMLAWRMMSPYMDDGEFCFRGV